MPTSNLSICYHSGTTPSASAMDWFSWLSNTNLEPSLIYDYGLTFASNELQLEDASYFNHEFLQSMGISVAKHRLEILKVSKKENGSQPKKLSGVIKKCLRKCVSKLVFREEAIKIKIKDIPEPNWQQERWRGALVRKQHGDEDLKNEKAFLRSRTMALSGPLDGRLHEKMITNNKVLKLSGPLDGRMKERMMMQNRSPIRTRPLDGRFMAPSKSPNQSGFLDARVVFDSKSPRLTRPPDVRAESPMAYSPYNKPKADSNYDDDHTLWPTLFQDLKPT